ncbi:MAG: glutathione S-transferase family protein [Pseudomonadota bacterium]
MADLKLYFFPRACSGVTMTALDMAGFDYDRQVINIFKGEQKSPEYLAIHPGGQVPALVVDGKPVSENSSILMLLDQMAPEAGILPASDDPVEKASYRSDLIRCSASIHPAMRQIRMPMRFTKDTDFAGIYADGVEKLSMALDPIEARLTGQTWFYGEKMSIIDVYLRWILRTAMSAEFPMETRPNLLDHSARVEAHPSYQAAMALEAEAEKAAGLNY